MAAEQDLQKMIASLQALGDLENSAAPDVADDIKQVLVENDKAHMDPYGKPWAVRKEDGEPALDDAEQSLRVAAVGNRIIMRIKGPYARHHLGKGSNKTQRKQIPDQPKLPDNINKAITEVLTRHFNLSVKK
jgi:hypothetical protein